MQEFRELLSATSDVIKGPIVIAIDELDKLHDQNIARELLRDVKGIFEVQNVYFLISISNEAQASFVLGALMNRSEFHSTFYKVIDAGYRTPGQCAELVCQRESQFPKDTALLLGVLSGGNIRELLRMVDIAMLSGTQNEPEAAINNILAAERTALLNVILDIEINDVERLNIYTILNMLHLYTSDIEFRDALIKCDSICSSECKLLNALDSMMVEACDRIIVRICIMSALCSGALNCCNDPIASAQILIHIAERSAKIALLRLKENIEINTSASVYSY